MKTTSKIPSSSNSNADEWLNSFDDPPKKSNDRYVEYFYIQIFIFLRRCNIKITFS